MPAEGPTFAVVDSILSLRQFRARGSPRALRVPALCFTFVVGGRGLVRAEI